SLALNFNSPGAAVCCTLSRRSLVFIFCFTVIIDEPDVVMGRTAKVRGPWNSYSRDKTPRIVIVSVSPPSTTATDVGLRPNRVPGKQSPFEQFVESSNGDESLESFHLHNCQAEKKRSRRGRHSARTVVRGRLTYR